MSLYYEYELLLEAQLEFFCVNLSFFSQIYCNRDQHKKCIKTQTYLPASVFLSVSFSMFGYLSGCVSVHTVCPSLSIERQTEMMDTEREKERERGRERERECVCVCVFECEWVTEKTECLKIKTLGLLHSITHTHTHTHTLSLSLSLPLSHSLIFSLFLSSFKYIYIYWERERERRRERRREKERGRKDSCRNREWQKTIYLSPPAVCLPLFLSSSFSTVYSCVSLRLLFPFGCFFLSFSLSLSLSFSLSLSLSIYIYEYMYIYIYIERERERVTGEWEWEQEVIGIL